MKDEAVRENAGGTGCITEKVLRDFAAERNVKAGALINGARVALAGQGVAPILFAVMANLGQERTVVRLKRAKEL